MRWILILVLVLSLSNLACGLFGGDDEPVANDSAAPAADAGAADATDLEASSETEDSATAEGLVDTAGEATAVPAPEVADDSATDESPDEDSGGVALGEALAGFDPTTLAGQLELDSYRFAMVMSFAGTDSEGVELVQSVQVDFAVVADPPATQMSISFEGVDETEELGNIGATQIGDTMYMMVPGFGCVSNTAGEDDLFDDSLVGQLFDPSELFYDLEGIKRVGEEVVNGIPTIVYEFDQSILEDESNLEWAEGRVYIAKDENYLVRLVLDGEGALDVFDEPTDGTGLLHIEADLTDVNQPIEIAIPEGCETGDGTGAELPMLPDAYEVVSAPGLMSYRSNVPVDEVLAFYEEALANDDWSKNEAESLVVVGTSILVYDRGDESLTLTIQDDEQGTGTVILIVTVGSG
jgi:hypothetical protein